MKNTFSKSYIYLQKVLQTSLGRPYNIIMNENFFWALKQVSYHVQIWRKTQVTHFQPSSNFYTPGKYQKISGFLMLSGVLEVELSLKMS